MRWQGFEGNSQWKGENKKNSNASSILDALEGLKQKVNIDINEVLNSETKLYNIHLTNQSWYWKEWIFKQIEDPQKENEF